MGVKGSPVCIGQNVGVTVSKFPNFSSNRHNIMPNVVLFKKKDATSVRINRQNGFLEETGT
jgi:hypothetical protein